MHRAFAAAVLGLLLTACATSPPRIVASAKSVEFSAELECVAECLDDGDACEACVDRCLRNEPGSVVASR